MRELFWIFVIYSIIGFAVETLYAAFKSHRLENRKTMLVLPMCPVYGMGAVCISSLANAISSGPVFVTAAGILAGTAVEYLYGYLCERLFHVRLWDYGYIKGSVHRRINLFYSIYWGVLSLALVYWMHPAVLKLIRVIPNHWLPVSVTVVATDFLLTALALYWFGRKESSMPGCPVVQRIID